MRGLKHDICLLLDRGAIAHESDIEDIDDEECKQSNYLVVLSGLKDTTSMM